MLYITNVFIKNENTLTFLEFRSLTISINDLHLDHNLRLENSHFARLK